MENTLDQMNQALASSVAPFAPNYYVGVRNPKWVDGEHKRIDCEVNFRHIGFEEWSPFTADPSDFMPYSKQIFDECVAGVYGPIQEYEPPPQDTSVQAGIEL